MLVIYRKVFTFQSSLEASSPDFPDHYLSPLKGYALHKIRIGDYRAIVSVEDEKIVVVTTDHRKNIYKSLERFYD